MLLYSIYYNLQLTYYIDWYAWGWMHREIAYTYQSKHRTTCGDFHHEVFRSRSLSQRIYNLDNKLWSSRLREFIFSMWTGSGITSVDELIACIRMLHMLRATQFNLLGSWKRNVKRHFDFMTGTRVCTPVAARWSRSCAAMRAFVGPSNTSKGQHWRRVTSLRHGHSNVVWLWS